jgi:hypothetical protein
MAAIFLLRSRIYIGKFKMPEDSAVAALIQLQYLLNPGEPTLVGSLYQLTPFRFLVQPSSN